MIYHYSLHDANRWALFSGDYNPIHFNIVHARRQGLEHLAVHGMRAMLDMKSLLTQRLLAQTPEAAFYRFSARLRKPLHCGFPYRLHLEESGGRFIGRMQDASDSSECFSARLAPAAPLEALSASVANTPLTAREEIFPGEANTPAGYWGFLDAVLFQHLLASPELLQMVNAVEPAFQAASMMAVFSRLPVVQTHHDVLFSAELFIAKPLATLRYAILPTQVLGDKAQGLVVSAGIQAWVQPDRPLMATTLTLKTQPLAALFD